MDAMSLNYWLGKFVMEVAKKGDERYSLKALYTESDANISKISHLLARTKSVYH